MNTKLFVLLGLVLVPIFTLYLGVSATRISHQEVAVGLVDGKLRSDSSPVEGVSSEDAASAAYVAPLAFSCEPERAFRSLLDFLSSESRARVLAAEDDYMHVVYFTPYLKLAQDVEFRLDATAGVVQVRAATRIGDPELLTHRERVEEIRRRWMPPPESTAEDG